jgi:two-component system cell cycle response regulator
VAENDVPKTASKVLVVDDNAQNIELLEAYMEELPGVTTLRASNGEEALRQVESQMPDLILLDVMMPRMSGFEVCKRLKNDPATRHIPVIMVTALHEMSDIERGVEVGTDDFITKPVNRVDLLTRVKSLLRLRDSASTADRELDYLEELEDRGEAQ